MSEMQKMKKEYVYIVSNNEGWDCVCSAYKSIKRFIKDHEYIKGIEKYDYSKFPVFIEDNATGIILFKKELK